jgi:hypothetical protein
MVSPSGKKVVTVGLIAGDLSAHKVPLQIKGATPKKSHQVTWLIYLESYLCKYRRSGVLDVLLSSNPFSATTLLPGLVCALPAEELR